MSITLHAGRARRIVLFDTLIGQYAEHWPLDRMAVVDRNILRLAVYELAWLPDTPAAVVLDEAIEAFRHVLSLNPGFVFGHYNLGHALFLQGAFADAAEAYAEGQRRYIESFSAYTRQFLQRLEKPEADRIDGIPPAIAVTGKNANRSSRSTVGISRAAPRAKRRLVAASVRG